MRLTHLILKIPAQRKVSPCHCQQKSEITLWQILFLFSLDIWLNCRSCLCSFIMTLECQKKKRVGKAHYRMKSTFTGKKQSAFGISGKLSLWCGKYKSSCCFHLGQKEKDDGSMISLVGSEASCDHWRATSCPALRICKDEIHMSGKNCGQWGNNHRGKKKQTAFHTSQWHSEWGFVTRWNYLHVRVGADKESRKTRQMWMNNFCE